MKAAKPSAPCGVNIQKLIMRMKMKKLVCAASDCAVIKRSVMNPGSISKKLLALLIGAFAVTTFCLPAQAQTAPDAGVLRQQIERDRPLSLPQKALPSPVPEVLTTLPGPTVTIKTVRFAGNTLISSEQLAVVVAVFLNRPLGFAQLQEAAAAVASAYRDAGWIVRAYLPRQDITEGVLTIQIVEAVFGALRIEGTAPARVPLPHLLGIFDAGQKAGEPLNGQALDRALLLADDLPGVVVTGSLRAGSAERETDLILQMADEPLLVGDATLDNTGARSTGREHLGVNASLNSAFGLGDLLSLSLSHSRGSDYLRWSGTAPLGRDGWRIGANASALRYSLIAPEFAALEAKGTSSTAGLEASYPLLRSRLHNLYLNLNAEHKNFNNESGGAITTRYQADAITLTLAGNLFDSVGGGGANSASLSLVGGKIDLDGSPNQADDAASSQTDGSYSKLRYALSRQQVLTKELYFFASLAGQWANKNLDSSEKFYLGGASGVRAYPSNEGIGTQGRLVNLELRWKLPQGFALTGFYDWGQVTVNRNNDFSGAPAFNDYALKGAGLALAWQSGNGSSLRATWARRIGDNPNPTASGSDQDGTLLKNTFWLSAGLPF